MELQGPEWIARTSWWPCPDALALIGGLQGPRGLSRTALGHDEVEEPAADKLQKHQRRPPTSKNFNHHHRPTNFLPWDCYYFLLNFICLRIARAFYLLPRVSPRCCKKKKKKKIILEGPCDCSCRVLGLNSPPSSFVSSGLKLKGIAARFRSRTGQQMDGHGQWVGAFLFCC